jgi:hypothetical protein
MDPAAVTLVEAIHRSPRKCVLAVTGGGVGAAAQLLGVPGGSRTVLEVVVPYAEGALAEFLGRRPDQFCSAATAREMAERAWDRARWLAPCEAVVGVGCTATLATDRPKRGDHRLHVAVRAGDRAFGRSLVLTKGARDRGGEDALASAVVLDSLAEACGVAERPPLPLLPGEGLKEEPAVPGGPLQALLRGEVPAVCAEIDGRLSTAAPSPRVLLSGSFNPAHDGHWKLAAAARRRLGAAVAFELSVLNVDKPTPPAEELYCRVAQFPWRAPVWLTRAPTFAEKARLFPGVTFVVGADTATRIVAPRYYGDEARMLAALDGIRGRGCRFLVAGRRTPGQPFVSLERLPIPEPVRDLFTGIPEAEFHVDLSSTELRAQASSLDLPPRG